jgi:hypothetical protein
MSEESHSVQDPTRRLVLGIVAAIQAVVLFFAAQIGLRIFSLRDQIIVIENNVARIEERQKSNLVLFENKLLHLQEQLNRIEAQPRRPFAPERQAL